MDKVVFLDRDGTINTEVNYLYRPDDLELLPGVESALAQLKRMGFKLVVVTNQAGVARGYYTESDVDALHRFLNERLEQFDAGVDRFFYCPHHPQHGIGSYKTECGCRKPNPGMLVMAEEFYKIDKKHSYMIGDKLADTQAGRNYGICSILVGTGYGTEIYESLTREEALKEFDYFAKDLSEAVRLIEKMERGV